MVIALAIVLSVGIEQSHTDPQIALFTQPKPQVYSAVEEAWLEVPQSSVPSSVSVTLKGDQLSCTWRMPTSEALPAGSSGVVIAAGYGVKTEGSRMNFRIVWLRGKAQYASNPRTKVGEMALVDTDGWRVVASCNAEIDGLDVTGSWRETNLQSVTMLEAMACYVPAGSRTPLPFSAVAMTSFRPRSGMTWIHFFPPDN